MSVRRVRARNVALWAMWSITCLGGGAVLSIWFLVSYYDWFSLPGWAWLAAAILTASATFIYVKRSSHDEIARLTDRELVLVPDFGAEVVLELGTPELESFLENRALPDAVVRARLAPGRAALDDAVFWFFQDKADAREFRQAVVDAHRARFGRAPRFT